MLSYAGIRWGTYLAAIFALAFTIVALINLGCSLATIGGQFGDYYLVIDASTTALNLCSVMSIAAGVITCLLHFFYVADDVSKRMKKWGYTMIGVGAAAMMTLAIALPGQNISTGLVLTSTHGIFFTVGMFVAVYNCTQFFKLPAKMVFSHLLRIHECRVC